MNAQLKLETDIILNNILSFSVAKIQKDIDDKKKLAEMKLGWKTDKRTLVFTSSRLSLDKFVESRIKDPSDITAINNKYYMSVNIEDFKTNKLCFENILIFKPSIRVNDEKFSKDSNDLIDLNIEIVKSLYPEHSKFCTTIIKLEELN